MDERARDAREVCAVLRRAGHRALFAGGCVRDMLLGIPPYDYDVATDAPAEKVLELFPRTAPVGLSFGVVLVLMPAGPVEVATFRRDGPYTDGRRPDHVAFTDEREDALRRDFTINALFYDPDTEEVLDYTGGEADLRAGRIRAVGDPHARFREDRLRLLRAVRFAARFGYAIEEATGAALRAEAPEVLRASAERIRSELVAMLVHENRHGAVRLLDDTGLLGPVLPEVAAMKGVEQPPEFHPEGDVFVHTLLVLSHLREPSPALAMAALLHDVGKPVTQTFDTRIRFNGHDKVGAEMAGVICRRLRFSNAETERIVWLVAQHMRLPVMPEMRESKRKRLIREPGFPELLALCRADALGGSGNLETIQWIEAYRDGLGPDSAAPPPLVTGKDLIALGYPQGPRYRDMLAAVEDGQLEGRLQTRNDALAYLAEHFPQE